MARTFPNYVISFTDAIIVILSVFLAYLVRFNFAIPASEMAEIPMVLGTITLIRVLLFTGVKSYIGIIRDADLTETFKLILILISGSFVFILADFLSYYLVNQRLFIPLTIIILEFLITTVLLLLFRSMINGSYAAFIQQAGKSVTRDGKNVTRDAGSVTGARKGVTGDTGRVTNDPKVFGLEREYAPSLHSAALISGLVAGKRILITGAGGCVGSELAHTLIGYQPEKLILADQSEKALIALEPMALNEVQFVSGYSSNEHRQSQPLAGEGNIPDQPLPYTAKEAEVTLELADITDEHRMEALFALHQAHLVFHAAAYNNVDLLEQHPREAIRVNVKGTRVVATLAEKYGAEKFVLLSSGHEDSPTTVWAASKRMAEMYVQSMGGDGKTVFITVRRTAPLHEFCHLALEAVATGTNGETYQVMVPELNRKLDQAKKMILQSGLQSDPNDDLLSGENIRQGSLQPFLVKAEPCKMTGETEQKNMALLCDQGEIHSREEIKKLLGL